MPRVRLSRLVWLVVVSQALCLAVVTTALLDIRNGLTQITIDLDRAASQPAPASLSGYSYGNEIGQRPTLIPPRMIGETNEVLDCMTNILNVVRQGLTSDAADEQRHECAVRKMDDISETAAGLEEGPSSGK